MLKRTPPSSVPVARYEELAEPVVDLVRSLSLLPEQQRMAVVMHDYADRPVKEVSAALGIATATVYVHLSRGRARLRVLLGDDEDA